MIMLVFLLWMGSMAFAGNENRLPELLTTHPFSYDLGIKVLPSSHANAQVTICAHGYGHSNKIATVMRSFEVFSDHIIGFNFPDYGITAQTDHAKSSFGTINEILPLLYIIKRCVIDLQIRVVNLYGFSAGGGAIVNALAALNQKRFDAQLKEIGISIDEKKQILKALQDGLVILNCPLKSMEEIVAFRGTSSGFNLVVANYAKNNMRPIDAIHELEGLVLNILLHFQNPDEILSNRDDALFIERLRAVNKGNTTVVIGSEGGHNVFHASLWKQYKKMKQG